MVFHTVCSETMKSVPRSCENGGPKDNPVGREASMTVEGKDVDLFSVVPDGGTSPNAK